MSRRSAHWRIQGTTDQGAMAPKRPMKFFVIQKKQILEQTGQLLEVVQIQKSLQI